MKIYRKYSIGFSFLLGCSFLAGCNYMNTAEAEGAVARVGENYLLEEEVNRSLGSGLTAEDSAIVSSNYINEWAKDQLLFERARINVPVEKQLEFEQLVSKYRADLYINAYKEALVNQGMDTVIGPNELEVYYENNKQNFRLNEDLVRLRYISLPKDFTGLEEIREAFRRFEEEDISRLRETALKFKFYSLNDSSWVRTAEVVKKIPGITAENKDQYLKKSQFFELSDSLGVYLVTVKEVLKRTETPPLDYVEPAIKKILLNKRKLEYIRKLEQELLEEAIRDKDFELLK